MGIQALVVLVGIAMALALGVLSAAWLPNTSGAGWLAIGLLPTSWALLHLTERIIGREVWYFTSPYPYPSMHTDDGVVTQPEAERHVASGGNMRADEMGEMAA